MTVQARVWAALTRVRPMPLAEVAWRAQMSSARARQALARLRRQGVVRAVRAAGETRYARADAPWAPPAGVPPSEVARMGAPALDGDTRAHVVGAARWVGLVDAEGEPTALGRCYSEAP